MVRVCVGKVLALLLAVSSKAGIAGTLSTGAGQAAEFILQRFGKRVPTQTIDEVAAAVSSATAKYGDEAVPFLKASGHAGFDALEQAGAKAPDVIKLYVKRGNEAVWIISKLEKLVWCSILFGT